MPNYVIIISVNIQCRFHESGLHWRTHRPMLRFCRILHFSIFFTDFFQQNSRIVFFSKLSIISWIVFLQENNDWIVSWIIRSPNRLLHETPETFLQGVVQSNQASISASSVKAPARNSKYCTWCTHTIPGIPYIMINNVTKLRNPSLVPRPRCDQEERV